MVVDVAPDSSVIYVHLFHLVDVDAARRSIAELERLAVGAIAGPSLTAGPSPTAPSPAAARSQEDT
jgi:hypothetical protein